MDLKNTYPASDFQIGRTMIARRRKRRRRGKGSGGGIPSYSDALFWLDGTMVGDTFVDKSGNGRDFTITSNDITVSVGFPYKSLATISPPVGDEVLIAADVNNFLYDAGGTPNAIPVVSLFQDIDYEHKLFCRHAAQVVDGDLIETYEPRVLDIVLYSSARTGADLTACQTYYGVPAENTTTMVWISPAGNDTSGDGSKTNPYQTLGKIKATDKTIVYAKTGAYNTAAGIIFTGNALTLQGLGTCSCTYGGAGLYFDIRRDMVINNFYVNADAANFGFYVMNSVVVNKCKLTKTNGTFIDAQTGMTSAKVYDSVLNTPSVGGLFNNSKQFETLEVMGCTGAMKGNINVARPLTTATLKYNKATGTAYTFVINSTDISFESNTGFGACTLNATNPVNVKYSSFAGLTASGAINMTDCTSTAALAITGIAAITGSTITGAVGLGNSSTINDSTITGKITANLKELKNSAVTGELLSAAAVQDMEVSNNTIIQTAANTVAVSIYAANDAHVTGIIVSDNYIKNNSSLGAGYTLRIGIEGANYDQLYAPQILRNKVENIGSADHTILVAACIDPVIKHNDVYANAGYGIVIKSAGRHYTTTTPHLSYNVFHHTTSSLQAIFVRGAFGVIASNNTIVGISSTSVVSCDADGTTYDNSLLLENNVISLAGNSTYYYNGANITPTNNSVNKNGHTLTQAIHANDDETAVAISASGVPASRLDDGVDIVGDTIGLASDYSIPDAVTYKTQDAEWQRGAVVL